MRSYGNNVINNVTALAAANAHTNAVRIVRGDFKFALRGTWAGTIVLLRKANMINQPQANALVQDGGDDQSVLTDSTLKGVTADELIGMYCRNSISSKDELAAITDNTATVVTCSLPSKDFDDGDTCDLWEIVGSYTDNQELVGTEPEDDAEYLALCIAHTSGTVRVVIAQ
jgi:hypothetical protein